MNRLNNIKKVLLNKVDALFISSPINIEYLTGYSNFSRDEREAYLLITKSNAVLFTDNRYIEAVEKVIPKNIKVIHVKDLFETIKKSKVKKVGIEHNFTVAELKKFKKETGSNFTLIKPLIENLRMIKEPDEIKNIRAACKLTDKTFNYIVKRIKIGVTEKEIAWEMEKFIKDAGGTLAFESIVAFGPNSSIPHHATSDKKLTNKDEFILLDFGAKVGGYCADMTRTILSKNASKKAKKMYETVLEAQITAQKVYNALYLKSGKVEANEGANVANELVKKNGFDSIPHGLGHGIGLEVHEKPHLSTQSKDILTEGMTFTIEPGIYIPGFGGVRIEDDYLLTKTGIEQLTKSTSRIIEI